MPKGIKGFQKGNDLGKTSSKNRRSYQGENNPFYGKEHSNKTKTLLSKIKWNKNLKDDVKYGALHAWVKKRLPKPDLCQRCNTAPAAELSNNEHTYKRNVIDWEWLCKSCHSIKDKRHLNFKKYARPITNFLT